MFAGAEVEEIRGTKPSTFNKCRKVSDLSANIWRGERRALREGVIQLSKSWNFYIAITG